SESLKPKVHRVVGFVLFIISATGLVGMLELREGLIGGMVAAGSTYLLSTIGASIFLTAMFIVSLLLITDLSFLGMWGNFEMARENFRVQFDEWWAKRAAIREQKTLAAKQNMAKRRDKKLGQPGVDSPTITLADAPKTRANAKSTTETTMAEI